MFVLYAILSVKPKGKRVLISIWKAQPAFSLVQIPTAYYQSQTSVLKSFHIVRSVYLYRTPTRGSRVFYKLALM